MVWDPGYSLCKPGTVHHRGFIRVMGATKMTVMLGFTLAAFNLDRIRSFRAKHALDEHGRPTTKPKRTRARRRTGTWSDVIEPTSSPPPE